MAREINTAVLDGAARHLAAEWFQPDRRNKSDNRFIGGKSYVMQELYNYTFRDAHEYVRAKLESLLGPDALAEFQAAAETKFTPRSDEVFHQLLADKLAIDPDGKHIPGKIGTTQVGVRVIGRRVNQRGKVVEARWPIYAGEDEERAADSGVADPLPDPDKIWVNDEHML